jgi:hypothetical protein
MLLGRILQLSFNHQKCALNNRQLNQIWGIAFSRIQNIIINFFKKCSRRNTLISLKVFPFYLTIFY